jgi:cardiolipin synthase
MTRSTINLDFVSGNRVTTFTSGRRTYDAILQEIGRAQHTIRWANFYFYWESGDAWPQIRQALIAAAQRGVAVQILADAYGTSTNSMPEREINRLHQAGIDWRAYNVWRPLQFWRYNRRLHKKLLIIDGEIGFTGGIGVGDCWILSSPEYPEPWRDTHFLVHGPIIKEMIAGFNDSWQQAGGRALESQPPKPSEAGMRIAAVNSPAGGGRTPVAHLYTDLINQAERSLTITSAYFGPDRRARQALLAAAKRGAMVRILINGPHTNHRTALEAGRHYYALLLRAGVHIYEYQPTKIHAKLITVDGHLSSIGSGNFNMRSLRHDDEFNLVIDDPSLATTLTSQFEHDLTESQPVSWPSWRARPLSIKLHQALSSLGRYLF